MTENTLDGIAPCGVLCFTCPSLLKGTCNGCRSEKKQKRTSKFACKIRKCCLSKGFITCSECEEDKTKCKFFSAKLLKTHNHDPRFQYRRDTLGHHELINELGLEKALEKLDERWKCPECGGRIQMYQYTCFECGRNCIDEMQGFKSFPVKPKRKKKKSKSKRVKKKKKPTKFQIENNLATSCGIYCGACRHSYWNCVCRVWAVCRVKYSLENQCIEIIRRRFRHAVITDRLAFLGGCPDFGPGNDHYRLVEAFPLRACRSVRG